MKPIRLKFIGLQSYRDEQVIDFSQLGNLGLFGIFGPTGSGKSTILDAITLALYGKVERAPGGTRGIMNQAAEKVVVAFEFLLGGNRYLVERSYGRNKHDAESVLSKNARLMLLEEQPVSRQTVADEPGEIVYQVLADKANEVNSGVENILGMSFADFTRAVILPQNKFDQFLKLTGGERAGMLEKIFCLEEYGEQLVKKTGSLGESLKQTLETNNKLLVQLGDASVEAVNQVTQQLTASKKEVKAKEKTKKEVVNKLKEMEQLAQVYQKIEDLTKQRENLLAIQPQIELKRRIFERGRKAETMRNLLVQAEDLNRQVKQKEKEVADKSSSMEAILKQVTEATERLQQARKGEQELNRLKAEELPKVRLIQDYQEQIKAVTGEGLDLANSISKKEIELKKTTALIDNSGQQIEELEKLQEKLTQAGNSAALILATRREGEGALTALLELEQLEKVAGEAANLLANKEKALFDQEAILIAILKKNQRLVETSYDKSLDDDADNEQFFATVPQVIAEVKSRALAAEERLNRIKEQNMAGFLAARLVGGKPCKVCGSTSHPNAARLTDIDEAEIAKASQELRIAREELDRLNRWEQELKLQQHTVQILKSEIESTYRPALNVKEKKLAVAKENYISAGVVLAQLLSWPEQEVGQLYSKAVRSKMKKFKSVLEQAEANGKEAAQQLENVRLKTRELEKNAGELTAKISGLQAEISNLKVTGENNKTKIKQLEDQITQMTAGIAPDQFAEEVNKHILKLEKELKQAGDHWEQIVAARQQHAEQLAGLTAGLANTKEHLAKISGRLEVNLVKEGFRDLKDLEEALIDEIQRQALERELIEYDKSIDHISKLLTELQGEVKDKPLDRQQLAESKELLETVNAAYDELVRQQGALENQLINLQQKQVEWARIQEENKSVAGKLELVTKLLSLLRGRRFVQFLAEEHLRDMAVEASMVLGTLTGQRFALELDDGCGFIMRDDYHGSNRRQIHSLSGGETFLTSLALALALSSKLQLKGRYPLGFFFLDEGFGTLDEHKLDVVIKALEKLHQGDRMVGIITHVAELRNRMPRYLEVTPTRQDGQGSKVVLKSN